MKNKEIQELKTSHLLATISLLIGCILVISPAWLNTHSKLEARALAKSESLAYQLGELKKKNPSRSPASAAEPTEGSIGEDPWGKPYQYRMVEVGEELVIEVWSQQEESIKTQVRIPLKGL